MWESITEKNNMKHRKWVSKPEVKSDVARKRNNHHSHNWRKIESVSLGMISVRTIPVNRLCVYSDLQCIRKRKRPAITHTKGHFSPWLALGKSVDYDAVISLCFRSGHQVWFCSNWSRNLGQGHWTSPGLSFPLVVMQAMGSTNLKAPSNSESPCLGLLVYLGVLLDPISVFLGSHFWPTPDPMHLLLYYVLTVPLLLLKHVSARVPAGNIGQSQMRMI